ncbi:MAG: hypothetical protein P8J50_11435 [Acidimicrobiales bacterium]|nr:hypothetical protein [Acidimicrobiales bacterium]
MSGRFAGDEAGHGGMVDRRVDDRIDAGDALHAQEGLGRRVVAERPEQRRVVQLAGDNPAGEPDSRGPDVVFRVVADAECVELEEFTAVVLVGRLTG